MCGPIIWPLLIAYWWVNTLRKDSLILDNQYVYHYLSILFFLLEIKSPRVINPSLISPARTRFKYFGHPSSYFLVIGPFYQLSAISGYKS